MSGHGYQDRPGWCCRYRWTLSYIAVVLTVEFVLMLLQLTGRLGR